VAPKAAGGALACTAESRSLGEVRLSRLMEKADSFDLEFWTYEFDL
jgi:hypothetical protein